MEKSNKRDFEIGGQNRTIKFVYDKMGKTEILKILAKKIIKLGGVEVLVELRMVKNTWGNTVFKPHAKFFSVLKSPIQVLKEKYLKESKDKTQPQKERRR